MSGLWGPKVEVDDTSDDGLFVQQPGEVKITDGIIDLTGETEAESNARAYRLNLLSNGLGLVKVEDGTDEVRIKHEDEEKATWRYEPDDESKDVFVPQDREEICGKREMLLIEQQMLQKRENKGILKPADRKRLEALGQEIVEADRMIKELEESQDQVRVTATDTTDAPEYPQIDKLNQEEQFAAPSAAAKGKRKATTQPKAGKRKPTEQPKAERVTKRPKRQSKTQAKSLKAAQKSAQIILNMLQNPDPITGQDAPDLPVLEGFEATTAAEQARQFIELSSKNPNADPKQCQGDRRMVVKARSALKGSRIKVRGQKFLINGMKTELFAYQFVGTGWMVAREKSSGGPYGGILADSMGLGKTVEALACIVGNPPSEEDKQNGLRTTLVVAPANAVVQWIEEVFTHCDGITACQYKMSDTANENIRHHFPIWVTSYEEVSMHFPSDNMIRNLERNPQLTARQCEQLRPEYLGPLFKTSFYRVILDEGHAIKTHTSQRAKACIELAAKYRWALTGTPIHNNVEEIFPYMRFLRAPGSSDIRKFKAKYLRGGPEGDPQRALSELLKEVMLKRNMHTKFQGHALFELPRPHVVGPVEVNLSREETLIYRRVEDKFRKYVSAGLKSASAPCNMWLIYVLRLRQAVSHPFLLEGLMKEHFEPDDIKWLIEQLSIIQTPTPFINQIGHWCEEQLKLRQGHEDAVGPGQEGLAAEFDMIPQLERLRRRKEEELQDLCRKCGSVPEDPFQPECGHVFCRDCVDSSIADEAANGKRRHGCRACNKLMSMIRASLPDNSQPSQPQTKLPWRRGAWRGHLKPRTRGDDVSRVQPTAKSSTTSSFLAESDRDLSVALMPSAKTIVVKNMIIDWGRRYPTDKIIVFTSFVDVGRIVGRMLQDEDIDFLYYFGSMSRAEKQQAVRDFTDKENIRILVASIQCSGQALNLACANRVVVVDVWWNAAIEQQAFGRVYRMGQKKETYLARIIVRNSIDERLIQLQYAKLKMVSNTIKESDSSSSALSAEEIASLFGRVVRDASGEIIDIVADYDDESDQGGGRGNSSDGHRSSSASPGQAAWDSDSSESDSDSD